MELRLDIDRPVVEWLASMGYPVAGMPREVLHGMLLREAKQWQVSLSRLRDLIDEGAAQSYHEQTGGHYPGRDAIRPSDRFAQMST